LEDPIQLGMDAGSDHFQQLYLIEWSFAEPDVCINDILSLLMHIQCLITGNVEP
jgi:hypothetical protein